MILLVNVITLYRLPLFFLAYRGIPFHVLLLYGFIIFLALSTWVVRKLLRINSSPFLHTVGLALALLGLTTSLFAIYTPLLALSLLCVGISTGFSIRINA
ncbi:MAG: hypothetical protein NUV52_03760 [Candidatus Roizmanbacteria bacterium]|nr:hypothetical protein [Candidatus Roizmanbacteria bacterium]